MCVHVTDRDINVGIYVYTTEACMDGTSSLAKLQLISEGSTGPHGPKRGFSLANLKGALA